jgi:uncharacterized protein YjbI with pentapeptide repeats
MVPFVIAGSVVGMVIALVLVTAFGGGAQWHWFTRVAQGASVGAIFGLFLGLGRGVWRPGVPLPVRGPVPGQAPQLWDPWLDSGRDQRWIATDAAIVRIDEQPMVQAEDIGSLSAQRALVRPRVVAPETREGVLLEDEIGALLQSDRRGYVRIVGGPGAGKTTALRHLGAILPPWARDRVQLVDEPDVAVDDPNRSLIIFAGIQVAQSPNPIATYGLALWRQDDLIEYLLAAHREQCASVMARLKTCADQSFVRGMPELWTIVLDHMAGDDSIRDVRSALRRELTARLGAHPMRKQVEDLCLTVIQRTSNLQKVAPALEAPGDESALAAFAEELFRLIRHRPIQLLLAADRIAAIVQSGRAALALCHQLPRELIHEAALQIADDAVSLQHLRDWFNRSSLCRAVHPMAASLLHAAMPGWRPEPAYQPRLKGAYLDRVDWPGMILSGVDLRSADLEAANLAGADLNGALATGARFCGANLQGAKLVGCRALGADFNWADLSFVHAVGAQLQRAEMDCARLIQADLRKASLREASIRGADFNGANLADACLAGLILREAQFEGARFNGADLRSCDLEGMKLAAPDFARTNLQKALLTGSRMPEANFAGADLRDAGLAEIDWPGANLSSADLRGASFHLGSSRNGLVGSPIACEGSRTGFYTDDYLDREIKPAEEIRKANLRGADLRGAAVEGVDFYLVDLRNAKYTREQAEQLHSCHAIIDDRSA